MMKKCIIVFLFFSFISAAQVNIDSVVTILAKTKTDTVRLRLLLWLAENHPDDQVWQEYNKKAVEAGNELIKGQDFAPKVVTAPLLAKAINNEGYIYLDRNEFFSAMQNFRKAEQLCIEYNKRAALAEIYSNMGACAQKMGRMDRAAEYYQLAIKQEELYPNIEVKGALLNNMASIHAVLGNTEKALFYYQKYIDHNITINDKEGLMFAYLNASVFFRNNNKAEKALSYALEANQLALELNAEESLYESYLEIGEASLLYKKVDTAFYYFNQALVLANKQSNTLKLATPYYDMGMYWQARNEYKKAEGYLIRSYTISDSVSDLFGIRNTTELLVSVYDSLNDIANSNKFLRLNLKAKEKLYQTDNSSAMVKLELQADYDKKEVEHRLQSEKQEVELKLHKKIRDIFMAGSLLLLIVIALIYFNLRNTKRSKELLLLKNAEIEKQKKLVIEKQNEMISSIHYAQRIQNAILTGDDVWKRISKDYFIFYQPKDIISGDFYWAHLMQNGRAIFAVADCTGHGVPGGLMSMLGNSFLNEIVVENKIFNAAAILNKLRDKIVKALEQKGDFKHQDGMDIALCVWNKMENTLEFAGANNSLYLFSENRMAEYKGSKMPIGTHINETTPFTSQTINLKKGDCIYLTTDGLPDQFGGPKAKKYKYSQLMAVVEAMNDLTLQEQGEILKKDLENWKGELEQTDDICVIGIKV